MDAEALITAWQNRLVAMVDERPFRFVGTTRQEAERYLQKSKTFRGFSEEEVTAAESVLGGAFPQVFRTYLRRMGRYPGELFVGSDLAPLAQLGEFRETALELFRDSGVTSSLPTHAAVFLLHQGYSLAYVLADGGEDGPVYTYAEDEDAPRLGATTFRDFVDAKLAFSEEVHRNWRAEGGYYLRVEGGGSTMHFPARASGERPLDGPDRFVSE